MGLADRDYMKPKAGRAANRGTPLWLRVKFWLWRLFKGK